MNEIDEIIPGLYVGTYNAALDKDIILSNNIQTIINCTKKQDKIDLDIDYLQIPIDDPPYITDINYINTNFIHIVTLINNSINKRKNVLIHCMKGSQRSAVIATIFIMIKFGLNYMNAIQFIKLKRPICFFGSVNYLNSLLYIQNQIDMFNRYYGSRQ
jgi:protein-tyrosine phosphatase